MSSPDNFDARRSTAILVGTSAYTGGLTSFAAADNSLLRMKALLTERCGWSPDRVHLFRNKSSEDPVLRDIARLIHATGDALLFYYVGHGQLIRGRQDLGLALSDTSTDRALRRSTSLLLSNVRREIEDSECRIRLVMLDCCYSGIAVGNSQSAPEFADEIQHLSQAEGVFTLTASRFNELAHYQPGDNGLTYFTKFLADVVEEGIPGAQEWLTGDAIYEALAQRFRDLRDPQIPDLPRPGVAARGGAGAFAFARNRAWRPRDLITEPPYLPGWDLDLAREWVEHDRFIARWGPGDVTDQVSRWPYPRTTTRGATASERMSVDVYQNEYLESGKGEVHAIVTASREAQDRSGQTPNVVFIVDCSDSMAAKLGAVRNAVGAAVEALRDGCRFAVIAGRDISELVYPRGGRLAVADDRTRAEAAFAVDRLEAGGRREFGLWLTRAARVFLTDAGRIRSALLITDGTDAESLLVADPDDAESRPITTRDALRACSEVFTCDCIGVGTDWKVSELRAISARLRGTVDYIGDSDALAAALRGWTEQTMDRDLADVALRLWTPEDATVRFIKQVAPFALDLSDTRMYVTPQFGDYATGAWAGETRDYHICIDVPAGAVGEEKVVGRVSMIVSDGDVAVPVGEGEIRAVWTDERYGEGEDRVDGPAARPTSQLDLALAIQAGLERRPADRSPGDLLAEIAERVDPAGTDLPGGGEAGGR